MRSRFAIVTDRTSQLSDDLVRRLDVGMIPFLLFIDDSRFSVSSERDVPQLYELLAQSNRSGTEAPTVEECREALERALQVSEQVLVICASRSVSAIYDRLQTAILQVGGKTIEVVAADSAATANGLLVTAAVDARDRGASLEAAAATVQALAARIETAALVETFGYLERSPAYPRAAELARSIRLAQPSVPSVDLAVSATTTIAAREVVNDVAEQLERLVEPRLDASRRLHVWVTHTAIPDAAHELLAWCRSRFDCVEAFASDAGPAIATHTGPGLLGISWYQDGPELAT